MTRNRLRWWGVAGILGCLALGLSIMVVKNRETPIGEAPAIIAPHIDIAASILDGYAGYYQWNDDDLVITVSREGSRLFVRWPGRDAAEIVPQSKTEFVLPKTNTRLNFTLDASGHAIRIYTSGDGGNISAPSVDPVLGRQLFADQSAKIHDHTATPGSAAVLRRVVDEVKSGRPNYDVMSPELAQSVRQNLSDMQRELTYFGEVKSIEFVGIDSNLADIYDVTQERAYTKWHIKLGQNGVIKYWISDIERPVRVPM